MYESSCVKHCTCAPVLRYRLCSLQAASLHSSAAAACFWGWLSDADVCTLALQGTLCHVEDADLRQSLATMAAVLGSDGHSCSWVAVLSDVSMADIDSLHQASKACLLLIGTRSMMMIHHMVDSQLYLQCRRCLQRVSQPKLCSRSPRLACPNCPN